ncbi:MAG: elongation factor 4 [Candidatus Levybacteria bacterium RIFCSPHIGHO2_01_FULL_36_15b]|nr:MAG: elongation factor 4 [Candidatus Levybacteria bacterium RIFCSPHIGHO2_01_FULL_36_15b]
MQSKLFRNFAIIAHVDHGKSTLADRFLEITKTIAKDKLKEQFLDQNPISRERGITIKLAPVRMEYQLDDQSYILNLIDTPGHMDFTYEVSRTLAACEGAILLVDATKGVQAQTLAHFNAAKKENLTVIPAINKIDSSFANIENTERQISEMFGFKKEELYYVSARTGEGVENLLKEAIKKIPPPKADISQPLRALIFDAAYNEHRGVIIFVKLVNGKVTKGEKIEFLQEKNNSDVLEVGFFAPDLRKKEELIAGEIGYIVTGLKDIRKTRVGDTITINNLKLKSQDLKVLPLSGYQVPKPMVFFGMYPKASSDYVRLREALNKLSLNDSSFSFSNEHSLFLGNGFRVGFLGLLHAEIVKDRLAQELGVEPLLTLPQVEYKSENGQLFEPFMELSIFVPSQFVGAVMNVAQASRGKTTSVEYHEANAILKFDMPYSAFIRGLASKLKSATSGYASLDYNIMGYKPANLEKLEAHINGTPIDVLTEMVYSDEKVHAANEKTKKLKENLERQQFRQIIQAKVGSQILAREEIPPFRKDVLAKMSGGDRTRKDKLLEAQKKGKSKLINVSKVQISQKALLNLVSEEF